MQCQEVFFFCLFRFVSFYFLADTYTTEKEKIGKSRRQIWMVEKYELAMGDVQHFFLLDLFPPLPERIIRNLFLSLPKLDRLNVVNRRFII